MSCLECCPICNTPFNVEINDDKQPYLALICPTHGYYGGFYLMDYSCKVCRNMTEEDFWK